MKIGDIFTVRVIPPHSPMERDVEVEYLGERKSFSEICTLETVVDIDLMYLKVREVESKYWKKNQEFFVLESSIVD